MTAYMMMNQCHNHMKFQQVGSQNTNRKHAGICSLSFMCSHENSGSFVGFSDADTDTDVDKVNNRNNHQSLLKKRDHYPDSDGTVTL